MGILVQLEPEDELMPERGAGALLRIGVAEIDPRLALVVEWGLEPYGVAAEVLLLRAALFDADARLAVLGQPGAAGVAGRRGRGGGRQQRAEGGEAGAAKEGRARTDRSELHALIPTRARRRSGPHRLS